VRLLVRLALWQPHGQDTVVDACLNRVGVDRFGKLNLPAERLSLPFPTDIILFVAAHFLTVFSLPGNGQRLAGEAQLEVVALVAGDVNGDDELVALVGEVQTRRRAARREIESASVVHLRFPRPGRRLDLAIESVEQVVDTVERTRSICHGITYRT